MNPGLVVSAAIAGCLAFSAVQASTILAPVSATVDQTPTSSSYKIENTFDQSGLSAGYVSGVTDWDTYFASTPTHDSDLAVNLWSGQSGDPTLRAIYDLGSSFALEAFALWDRGRSAQGIGTFNLLFSDNSDLSGATVIGNLASPVVGTSRLVEASIYTFAPITARYVGIDTLTARSATGLITYGEVAFAQVAPVPLPASLPLLILGMAGLFGLRRRAAN